MAMVSWAFVAEAKPEPNLNNQMIKDCVNHYQNR